MSEYDEYLKDQHEDGIFDPEYMETGRQWSKKYMDFLIQRMPNDTPWESMNILDVGCREFFTFDYFQDNYNNAIMGIDIGAEGLDYAQKHKRPAYYCDAHKLTERYKDDSMDLIICIHSLEHMYDMKLVLQQFHQVIKPGGYLYFAVPVPCKNVHRGHWANIPNPGYMTSLCRRVGFEKEYQELFLPGEFREEQETIGLFKKC